MRIMHLGVVVAAIALSFAPNIRASGQAVNIYSATLLEPNANTGEVSTEELRRILADGSAIVIDSRPRTQFEASHIPAAHVLDMPADDQVAAVERLANGDKAAALVIYCNGPYCQASRHLADRLTKSGFKNVRRYQVGIPVWRALGGPTVIELEGILRIFKADRTAVFVDTRDAKEFANGSLPGARNLTVEALDRTVKEMMAGTINDSPLPLDDFNRRIVLFGSGNGQVLGLAKAMTTRAWHNVMYFPGSYDELTKGLRQK